MDHRDGNNTNNSLSNLRFVSPSDNQKNRNGIDGDLFEFVKELPEDAT